MSDSLYVNDNGTPVPLNLGTGIEFVERIEALEEQNAAQDAAISSKVATVNGLTPDSNGNVDVGGMPLGILLPYTGKDVPPGFLRPDGATYPGFDKSFPDFYAWLLTSGLTKPLADYTLVEGNCGYYGIDEATGTVRVPTITNGFVGAAVAGQYGQAVQAGLPNITGWMDVCDANGISIRAVAGSGALFGAESGSVSLVSQYKTADGLYHGIGLDLSRSNAIYGRSDTVTPSHVKYPWVIVVYNAAVPPSVAQAGEFVELLDGKVDKVNPKDSAGKNIVRSVQGWNADANGNVTVNTAWLSSIGMPGNGVQGFSLGASGTTYTAPKNGYFSVTFDSASSGAYIALINTTNAMRSQFTMSYGGHTMAMYMPAKQGDKVQIFYTNAGVTDSRFVYANGEG